MANNLVFKKPDNLALTVAGAKSGDPVAVGGITGVALIDAEDDGACIIRRKGVFELNVEGVNMVENEVENESVWEYGDVAVSIGDKLYYDATREVKINKNDHSGTFFGYALGTVGSGANATIQVLLK